MREVEIKSIDDIKVGDTVKIIEISGVNKVGDIGKVIEISKDLVSVDCGRGTEGNWSLIQDFLKLEDSFQKGDTVEGQGRQGETVKGEYVGYYTGVGEYCHTVRVEGKLVDIKNPVEVEEFEDGDVLMCDCGDRWMFVFNKNGEYIDSHKSAFSFNGCNIYNNYNSIDASESTNIRKATEEGMARLTELGYEIVDDKFVKIKERVVLNNGVEGEFNETWTEKELGDRVYYLDDDMIESVSVSCNGDVEPSSVAIPSFKTKKRLFQYLASITND